MPDRFFFAHPAFQNILDVQIRDFYIAKRKKDKNSSFFGLNKNSAGSGLQPGPKIFRAINMMLRLERIQTTGVYKLRGELSIE